MRALALALLAGLAAGCAEETSGGFPPAAADHAMKSAAPETAAARREVALAEAPPAMMGGMMGSGSGAGAAGMMPSEPPGGGDVAPVLPRKIIYTADIGLVVEDFPKAEATIRDLVQKHRGYVAEMTLTGSPGVNRSARWKVRVPVETFEAFLAEAGSVGELERSNRTSSDVSEEFYDTEARIRNKKVEESRLIKILEENTGKLEEVLRIEGELSRVRGEVERMEGRIRVLENLTSLTTVTIDVRERVKYEPPPPVAASFPTRLQRATQDSWDRLVRFGENLVIGLAESWTFLVFFLLPALVVGLLLLRFVWRRLPRWLSRVWALLHTRLTPPPPSPPSP
jgi:hypothetical protein